MGSERTCGDAARVLIAHGYLIDVRGGERTFAAVAQVSITESEIRTPAETFADTWLVYDPAMLRRVRNCKPKHR